MHITEQTLSLRTQAALAVRRGHAPGEAPSVAFANTNRCVDGAVIADGTPLQPLSGTVWLRFWVPEHLVFDFVKALAAREVMLQDVKGFIGLTVKQLKTGVSSVRCSWFW